MHVHVQYVCKLGFPGQLQEYEENNFEKENFRKYVIIFLLVSFRLISLLDLKFPNLFLLIGRILKVELHTYRHNWPLQPFSRDYGLASYTTHVECVNFIREFNVDSE